MNTHWLLLAGEFKLRTNIVLFEFSRQQKLRGSFNKSLGNPRDGTRSIVRNVQWKWLPPKWLTTSTIWFWVIDELKCALKKTYGCRQYILLVRTMLYGREPYKSCILGLKAAFICKIQKNHRESSESARVSLRSLEINA